MAGHEALGGKLKAKKSKNDRLEEAIAIFIQNQASFLGQMAEIERATSERFARIEERLAHIESILLEHGRVLEALPEAIRQELGFRPPE